MPGGIILTVGIVCQIATLFDSWDVMWPGFILAVAVGLFELYLFGSRNRWLFIPIGILTTLSMLFFAVFGQALLSIFGITLPALRIAGGVLLLLISIDMVFARHSGGTGTTPEEENEARTRPDISVFPLATPLIAGPGAISATILLATPAGLFSIAWLEVVVALLAILILCYLAMLVAIPIQRLLGLTGLAVVSRVVGVLLAALAMQFLIDGIAAAALFGPAH